jgi:hypothetical protein
MKFQRLIVFVTTISSGFCAASLKTIQLDKAKQPTVLTVQKGVSASVRCSSQPRLELSGSHSALNHFEHQLSEHQLLLDGHEHSASLYAPDLVHANIYLSQPLTHVSAERGGFVTLNDCAVSRKELSLHMMYGGHIKLNAQVQSVALTASQGGFFNQDFDGKLTSEHVAVSCGLGCSIFLGPVKKVSGSMMMGGQLYMQSGTNMNALHQTVGASVHID